MNAFTYINSINDMLNRILRRPLPPNLALNKSFKLDLLPPPIPVTLPPPLSQTPSTHLYTQYSPPAAPPLSPPITPIIQIINIDPEEEDIHPHKNPDFTSIFIPQQPNLQDTSHYIDIHDPAKFYKKVRNLLIFY